MGLTNAVIGAVNEAKQNDHGVIGLSQTFSHDIKPVLIQAFERKLMDKPVFTMHFKKCNGSVAFSIVN
jgi:hypothetical protein